MWILADLPVVPGTVKGCPSGSVGFVIRAVETDIHDFAPRVPDEARSSPRLDANALSITGQIQLIGVPSRLLARVPLFIYDVGTGDIRLLPRHLEFCDISTVMDHANEAIRIPHALVFCVVGSKTHTRELIVFEKGEGICDRHPRIVPSVLRVFCNVLPETRKISI